MDTLMVLARFKELEAKFDKLQKALIDTSKLQAEVNNSQLKVNESLHAGMGTSNDAFVDKIEELEKSIIKIEEELYKKKELQTAVGKLVENRINQLEKSLKTKGETIDICEGLIKGLTKQVRELKSGGHSAPFLEGH